MPRTKTKPEPIRVEATRIPPEGGRDEYEGLERLARLLDSHFRLPGTNFRFGIDPLLGLVPVAGDTASGLLQAGVILLGMYYYKVPRRVLARMVFNVLLDTSVGSIPILGHAFDFYFKASKRNVDLLREVAAQQKRHQR